MLSEGNIKSILRVINKWIDKVDAEMESGVREFYPPKFGEIIGLVGIVTQLKADNARLQDDLMAWLSLAKRQYKEMSHNEPLCPTKSGIMKTQKLLGI